MSSAFSADVLPLPTPATIRPSANAQAAKMEPGSGTTSFQDAGESSGCELTSSGDAADRCKTEGPDQNEKIVKTGLEPLKIPRPGSRNALDASGASARWNIGHDFAVVKESGDGLYASLCSEVQQSTQAA